MARYTLRRSTPSLRTWRNPRGAMPTRSTTVASRRRSSVWQFRRRWRLGSPLSNTRQSQYTLLRSRAHLQQVVHQATHTLARFFLEIDANYKQFKTASRLRAAAAQRLDAQRAYYEEGRITIDRFLDAVSQYATAVATEAQYKTTYNIAIVALEEAKGTLLAYDNIVVGEPNRRPKYVKQSPPKPDSETRTASALFAQDPFKITSPTFVHPPANPIPPTISVPLIQQGTPRPRRTRPSPRLGRYRSQSAVISRS